MKSVTLTPEQRFYAQVERIESGCLLWRGVVRGSYGRFWLGTRNVTAHVWAYESINGPIPPKHRLHHQCEVRLCVEPTHLIPVTFLQHRHLHLNRHHPMGLEHYEARLTPEIVHELRTNYRRGMGVEVARQFGVTRAAVSRARLGLSWKAM